MGTGTPIRRRGATHRGSAVGVVLMILLALLAPLLTATPVAGADNGDAVADSVHVRIDSVTPANIRPDSVVSVSGVLTNRTSERFRDLQLRLQSDDPITSRVRLHLIESVPRTPEYSHQCRFSSWLHLGGTLEPHTTRAFSVACRARDLSIGATGVYPLLVNLNADRADGTTARVGEGYTVLSYFAGAAKHPAQVSWLWPIVGTPHRLVGSVDDPAVPVFADDTLATAFAPNGRYHRLVLAALNAPPAVALTLVLDPDVVDSARVMAQRSHPYLVEPAAGGTFRGTGAAAASTWLAMLRELVRRTNVTVAAVPYGDPDLVALSRVKDPGNTLALGYGLGSDVLRDVLGIKPPTLLAWPAEGAMDQNALVQLAPSQAYGFILDSSALPVSRNAITGGTAGLPSTSGARRALVSDEAVNTIAAQTSFPDGRAAATERFTAELAVIAATPNSPRTVVVVPRRNFVPGAYSKLLLQASVNVPFARSVAATDLLDQAAPARGALHYSKGVAGRELPTDLVSATYGLIANLDDFQTALDPTDAATRVTGISSAILRTTSCAWRYDRPEASLLIDNAHGALTALRQKVRINPPSKGIYSLSSSSGLLVVTVDNKLDYPVTVRVTAKPRQGVPFRATPVKQRIAAHAVATVRVPAKVESSGRFQAYLEISTPGDDGIPLGAQDPPLITLRSTAYGVVAVVITAAALTLLMVLMSRRLYQRLKRARSGPDEPPIDPASGAPVGAEPGLGS